MAANKCLNFSYFLLFNRHASHKEFANKVYTLQGIQKIKNKPIPYLLHFVYLMVEM